MKKVGEHVTIDFLGVKKDYTPEFYNKVIYKIAKKDRADYVAFGAFFSSTTKVTSFQPKIDLIKIWNETTLVPSVAIGGINHLNCKPLIEAGANYLAVISAVWDYPEGPKKAVNKFTQIFLCQ